jgi:uncharacterized protein
MKLLSQHLRLAATDLSNHLACHHLTELQLSVARGNRAAPKWQAPDLIVIQELGDRHEQRYLDLLQSQGLSFVNLRDHKNEQHAIEHTLAAMESGLDVIAQGALDHGRWFGRPDVLRKVTTLSSRFGNWSYEVYDCKLTRETKAATILQLALYSEILTHTQGEEPEFMHVIPGGADFKPESYRCDEYAAYYRYVKTQLENVSDHGKGGLTYPEPCTHCDVCRYFAECDKRRRDDDSTSLVAGITKLQRNQLNEWDAETMAKLALLPIPLEHKPLHGSKESYERVREQARLQVEARTSQKPVFELLKVVQDIGFCKLPAPSTLDMFVDLEGDPFAGPNGQEYLFGFAAADQKQTLRYEKRWSLTAGEEKCAFEWLMDEIIKRWEADPTMHVYHFGGYEETHFKLLAGRYATREDELDRMLRADVLVDLHTIFKQAVRAGVEEYSLKKLEIFHNFKRTIPREVSLAAMRYIEHWLELERGGELRNEYQEAMEGYNEDDCRSTASLRDWLETERRTLEQAGTAIPRPTIKDGAPSDNLNERQQRVAALVARLVESVPGDPAERNSEQAAQWMLAQLLDWHRREEKFGHWQYFKFAEMDDDDLADERCSLSGLQFVHRTERGRELPVDTYSFPAQDTGVHAGDEVCHREMKLGTVESIDFAALTVDIKKTKKSLDAHPRVIFGDPRGPRSLVLAESLYSIGEWVRDSGVGTAGRFEAISELLLRKPPRLKAPQTLAPPPGEVALATAQRVVRALDHSVFAIQGPPGAGKTYTAAHMICELVAAGKKVGVTALSHKVIRKVLEVVQDAAKPLRMNVRCIQKAKDGDDTEESLSNVETTTKNEIPLARLQSGAAKVAAGTAWMWARPEYFEAVDVLFIDEAGQMALADVVAVAQAAKNLVLVGDPQQLQRPLKGSHPDGAELSALQYLLGEHLTIPADKGLLLPETWRMHPAVCKFTSQVFYEDRLTSRSHVGSRVIAGHPWISGAGLWFVPVVHEANRNSSDEEVEVIAGIVESLLGPCVTRFRSESNIGRMELKDILVVAPYNAQVSDLLARLPEGARVGTVDKFQGQEAPVVIYSLTTSTPEDAPRGMEFLYSLNRLNVATSRAESAVIVVGSPRLFEPDCKTPRQMQLANALCRYREMAITHNVIL